MRTRATITITLLCVLLLTLAGAASAQNDGQFCARAYEDRNGNGTRDTGEPFLTRGVGATLQDARGVVVATAILDNSPTAGQGVICFQNLAYEQYTLTITSAEYDATTSDTLIAELVRGETPPVLEYGGQRADMPAVAPVMDDEPAFTRDELVERLLVAAVGAGVAMLLTALFGFVLWLLLLRPRRRPVPAGMMPPDDARYMRPDPRQTTGSMQPVDPRETSETRR